MASDSQEKKSELNWILSDQMQLDSIRFKSSWFNTQNDSLLNPIQINILVHRKP